MLPGPDHLQDPFPLYLLLEPAKGLLEGLIFADFNDWHASMLLQPYQRVKLTVTLPPMTDPQHQNPARDLGVNHTIIANPVFEQTSELAVQKLPGIGVG